MADQTVTLTHPDSTTSVEALEDHSDKYLTQGWVVQDKPKK